MYLLPTKRIFLCRNFYVIISIYIFLFFSNQVTEASVKIYFTQTQSSYVQTFALTISISSTNLYIKIYSSHIDLLTWGTNWLHIIISIARYEMKAYPLKFTRHKAAGILLTCKLLLLHILLLYILYIYIYTHIYCFLPFIGPNV